MNKIIQKVIIFALLLACITGYAGAYEDIKENAWYTGAVNYVTDAGLMNGIAEDHFAPELPVSRAMCVTVLWRMAGSPRPAEVEEAYATYADVHYESWYGPAVYWAYPDIMNGFPIPQEDPPVPTGIFYRFQGEDALTREQLAVVLYRYHGRQDSIHVDSSSEGLNRFTDKTQVSLWAEDAVKWCIEKAILQGIELDGVLYFDPQGTVSRAQLATVLMRYCTGTSS